MMSDHFSRISCSSRADRWVILGKSRLESVATDFNAGNYIISLKAFAVGHKCFSSSFHSFSIENIVTAHINIDMFVSCANLCNNSSAHWYVLSKRHGAWNSWYENLWKNAQCVTIKKGNERYLSTTSSTMTTTAAMMMTTTGKCHSKIAK